MTALALFVAALLALAACGGQPPEGASENGEDGAEEQAHPDVEEAELERSGEGWSLSVTISSPYDSPERYADGWRVLSPDGEILGEHELGHDHANEQPFTRTQTGLEIPEGVEEITVEGRDLENGYGGETVTVPVER
ncbi:MAG: hypothetical protein H0V53_03305 [Rubrobacter sp.]|nr:hypothetical protein [Rubrobacter sp.]